MKFTIFLCLAAFAALGSADDVAPVHPAHICYRQVQACCFRFSPCGFITKKKIVVRDCGYRKCRPHCETKCHKVPVVVKKRVCRKVTVPGPKACKYVKVYEYGRYNKVYKCTPTYRTKVQCHYRKVTTYKKECRRVCSKHCVFIEAKCIKYRVYKYVKYCAKKYCDPYKYSGKHAHPADIIAVKGLYVKTTEEVRKPTPKGLKVLAALKH